MKHAMPLLAAVVATTALADLEPIQPQGFPPMMAAPMMPGAYNPYPMMPYGMPMQQMPYGLPYGVPMQQMPAMPYGVPMQMPGVPYGMPYPMMPVQPSTPMKMLTLDEPAPAAETAPAPVAAPAPAPVAVPAPAPAPTPVAAPAPAPVAAPTQAPVAAPAPAPVAAPAPAPVAAPAPAPVAAPAPAPVAAPAPAAANPYLSNSPFNPFGMMMGMGQPSGPKRPYEMRRTIEQAEKTQMMQMFLPMVTGFMQMGMPDAMNYFARKYKAQPGLSFDDVRDSLFLRANQLNMKKVGENLMWKDFQVVLNDTEAPRIEVYSFCDIAVARDLLKISPEFVVFLPCRVAIMEDADKNVWVLMVDWNLDWVAGYEQKLGLTPELAKGARSINERMDEMMRAAANGDL